MTETKIKVAVADDQKIFRNGFVRMLHDVDNLEVVIEANNGKELINALTNRPVDLVFVDFRMPQMNGMSAIKIIHKKYPEIKILMLSSYSDDEFVEDAIKNGAHGYLSKDDEPDEIYLAINSVQAAGYYLNARASPYLIKTLMSSGAIIPEFRKPVNEIELTESEIVVMRLIAKQKSTKEIAKKIFRSERTVDSIRTSIMEKTGAINSVGIVMFGIKAKLIEEDY